MAKLESYDTIWTIENYFLKRGPTNKKRKTYAKQHKTHVKPIFPTLRKFRLLFYWFSGRREFKLVNTVVSNVYSPRKLICSQFKGETCFNKSSRKFPSFFNTLVASVRYTVFHTLMALMIIFNALARCNWSCKPFSRNSPRFPKNKALANPFMASPLFKPR